MQIYFEYDKNTNFYGENKKKTAGNHPGRH